MNCFVMEISLSLFYILTKDEIQENVWDWKKGYEKNFWLESKLQMITYLQ